MPRRAEGDPYYISVKWSVAMSNSALLGQDRPYLAVESVRPIRPECQPYCTVRQRGTLVHRMRCWLQFIAVVLDVQSDF